MKPAVVVVILTVMIDAMGIGLMVPVMPDLIREVNGGNLSQAAIWGGILTTTFAVMQFLFGPTLGSLSDRIGRRPVLLTSLMVMAADYVVMALAGSIWLLVAGRVVGGITAATQSTAYAYMADISAPEERTKNFGLIGAGFGLGFVLGPLMGGILAEYGTRAPFWAAAALAFGNGLLGWVVLSETVTAEKVRAFEWRRANPLGAFKHLSKLPGLGLLLFVYFLYHVGFAVYPSVWSYFGQEQFNWPPSTIGMSLALFGLSMALIQAGVIRLSVRQFGEIGTVLVGHIFALTAYLSLSLITSGTLALILTPLAALAGLIPPALTGIMSARTPDNAQGELQGVLTSASSLAMILSPLVMTSTFAYATAAESPIYLPGAPFLLAFLLTLIALATFLMRRRDTDVASTAT